MKTGREIIVVEKEHISVVIIKKNSSWWNGDWWGMVIGIKITVVKIAHETLRLVVIGSIGDWLKDDCD